VNELQRIFPDAKEEYLKTKDDIKALGVTAQTTYLYIQGHHLFDTVVSPIMSKVCNLLRQERQNEIYHAVAHRTQKRNEMTCYENSLQDIKVMLKKNTGYMMSEPFRRLQEDVRHYLQT
jgi:antibiotic biosynthesis monooxygenase (ABM) superfamily enzyme